MLGTWVSSSVLSRIGRNGPLSRLHFSWRGSSIPSFSPFDIKKTIYIDYVMSHQEEEQKYHYDHPVLHYGVIIAAGLIISWIIQSTYGPVADGQAKLIAENMVIIFVAAAAVGVWTRTWFV